MESTPRPWEELASRFDALRPERATACALACAERLAALSGVPREDFLRDALRQGWSAVLVGLTDVGALVSELEARDDLDNDGVAALVYALRSVSDPSCARWVASRSMDAAFARVAYPDGATQFRPVDEDAATQEVQWECAWQEVMLELAEGPLPLAELARLLRSRARQV